MISILLVSEIQMSAEDLDHIENTYVRLVVDVE